jgi:hypothetical protein
MHTPSKMQELTLLVKSYTLFRLYPNGITCSNEEVNCFLGVTREGLSPPHVRSTDLPL